MKQFIHEIYGKSAWSGAPSEMVVRRPPFVLFPKIAIFVSGQSYLFIRYKNQAPASHGPPIAKHFISA
ncbi:MAG: hypothetical protein WC824_06960 [Bacteroidota bacterium]